MSGYKRSLISMDEEDYRRLHAAEMERMFKAVQALESKSTGSELSAALQSQIDQLEDRQDRFANLATCLDAQAGKLEMELGQELAASQMEFCEQLTALSDQIWDNSDQVNAVLNTFFEHSRQDNKKLVRQQKRLTHQIHQFIEEREEKQALAIAWFESTLALDEFIRQNYDHEHFYPGLLENIYEKIELAQYNLERGMTEAALGTAQDTYLQLSGLRQSLEHKTFEFDCLFNIVDQASANLYYFIKENANCPALDLEGNDIGYPIELNYWSTGRYNELFSRLNGWIQFLHSERNGTTYAQLQDCLQNDLPRFRQEFDAIIYDARLAAINSQIRANIAEIAIIALQKQGYSNQKLGFESNDQRKTLCVTMGNIEGSRVTIQVRAANNQEMKNDLIVESGDSQEKTERELHLRYEEIRKSLMRFGLQVGPIESSRPAVRRQPAAQLPQPVSRQPISY